MTANTMTLKSYLTAIILVTITLIIAVSGGLLVFATKQTYLDGVSQRGIELAQVLASDERVIAAIQRSNSGTPTSLQDYIENLRAKTDASYIVVTNRDGIRLSHPLPERIGKRFIGEDILPTLNQGQTRTTEGTGSLGTAIRNFAPVFATATDADANSSANTLAANTQKAREVIGAISIGYLRQSVADLLFQYYKEAIVWLGIIYVLAILLTLSLLSKLKRTFLDYEPEEIVQRFKEHSLLLDSIREGIIAIDRDHRITAINKAASYWIAPDKSDAQLIGLPLDSVSPGLEQLIIDSLSQRNKHSITLGRHTFAVTLYPLNARHPGLNNAGFMMVLNHEQDMSELQQELAATTAWAQQLRAQTHEHNNKLNVISGLLQADKVQDAIDYLQQESDQHQQILGALVKRIENSPVAGMLLAKHNYASNHHIQFTLDEDSQLGNYPQATNDDLITLIGNLVDNAFEAAQHAQGNARRSGKEKVPSAAVSLYLSDRNKYLMITVEDNGKGVDTAIAERMFELGVSGKEIHSEHGMGLYLVSRVVHRYNGTIDWERIDDTTVFSVYLDKRALQQ
ncbi:sensor histidine kinase [Oceanobacter kriegii]|uniref:sensor histidine kinase n=1 Tax=Oceanobacter kriegii TaxID=64972 RepID=UPI00042458E9|nr:sensor histidine kinase [Oceanobacter kriegii]